MTGNPTTSAEARELIFSAENRKAKSILIDDFYGMAIEIRQPTVIQLSEYTAQDAGNDGDDPDNTDKKLSRIAAVQVLIGQSYLPGTDEKVFDPADYDQLTTMPMSASLSRAFNAITSITGLDVETKAKNSKRGR